MPLTGFARRADALAVHLDGAHRELQIGRGLRQRPADGTLVLELVVERENLGAGTLVRKIASELVADFVERPDLLGLDLERAHQHGAEAPLDRRADLVLLQREGGIGDGLVDDRGLRERTEIDFLFGELAFLGDVEERFTLGDAVGGGLRFLRIAEDDLLKGPALGREIARAALLVGASGRPHRRSASTSPARRAAAPA